MKKIYLAGGISDEARKEYQRKIAKKIRDLGYEVYAAAENDSINDKSNDPTPGDIYDGDIPRVLDSDIFVMTISGAGEDGTISEVGAVAGWNEMVKYHNKVRETLTAEGIYLMKMEPIKIVAYTTNERLMQPQFYKGDKENIKGLASAGYNHLVLAYIDRWGSFVGDKDDMLEHLDQLRKE